MEDNAISHFNRCFCQRFSLLPCYMFFPATAISVDLAFPLQQGALQSIPGVVVFGSETLSFLRTELKKENNFLVAQ